MVNYSKRFSFTIKDGEFWWGGVVAHGQRMPLTKNSEYSFDCNKNATGNPYHGLFTSNLGRYLYVEGGSAFTVKDGIFTVFYNNAIEFSEHHTNLKSAYLAAAKKYFPRDSVEIPTQVLTRPQFCTWAEMDIHVSQEKIEKYVDGIQQSGMPYGLLIVDDGWSYDYGDWRFNEEKFPNPKAMVDKLHAMGFAVELWIVPFVNASTPDYQLLCQRNAFIRDNTGAVAKKAWWNGTSALLDMTNPFAWEWLKGKLDILMQTYGVDGFKFDAGGENYYTFDDITYEKVSPAQHCDLWAKFANQYRYNELREVLGYCGQHYVLRLNDKRRSWSETDGIGALVPHTILAGLCGYPFCCPDMIGGGQIADFRSSSGAEYDFELVSRFCECSALMPSMQFSHAYWEKDGREKSLFLQYALLHTQMEEYLLSLIQEAKETHAPIVRHLEYEFPHQGYAKEMRAFMFGSDYLVTPVTKQGETTQTVRLPKGADWTYVPTGKSYRGGETVCVSTPVGTLAYFKKNAR